MTSHCNGSYSKTCLSLCLRETENWNSSSKTLFYKDCSLGSVKNTFNVIVLAKLLMSKYKIIIIIIDSFYIELFSALKQTHCAHWHVIVNEWLYPFIARIINIHGSDVLVALCGCCMAGATWNAAFRRRFCVHHSTMHQVTVSLHSKPHR